MSSHSVKLSKAIKRFEDIKKALQENVSDEYSRGLSNGLELAKSIMLDTDPVYTKRTGGGKARTEQWDE